MANLKRALYDLLSIKPNEADRVFLLLGMGFFMGLFLATLDVGAVSLFLNNFDEKADLPLAFLLSGIFGIITTAIYNFFQSRISFSSLAFYTIIVLSAILFGIVLSFGSLDDPRGIYFFAFVFTVPANFLVLLIFWSSFGRMFDLRQSKRIIGSIDTGQLVASIIALFSIPFLLDNIGLTTEELLIVSLGSIIGYILVFAIINRKQLFITGISKTGDQNMSYSDLLSNKYIVLMIIFVIISMVAIQFIDYSFLSVTTLQFDKDSLPNFISYFEAAIVIFSFLFQTFVTDRIIALYGLKVALLVNPVLIALFTFLAIPIGYLFGYTNEYENFIFFFIIISMSKLFSASLKDALDGPAFKLYFLPIDSEVKFDVQTKVEGVISALASLLAGGLIILINNVQIFSLIHISIFTLPAVLLWYFTTTKLYRNYRRTLQNMLKKSKRSTKGSTTQRYAIDRILQDEVKSNSDRKVLTGLTLMEKIEPALFESTLPELTKSDSEEILHYAEEKIRRLKPSAESTMSKLAKQAIEQMASSEIISVTEDNLARLVRSEQPHDRVLAAKLLNSIADDQNVFLLLELLRDIDPGVKIEAIATARKVQRKETWPILIDLLNSPTFSNAASCALTEAGEACLFTLENAFHKSGQKDNTMFKIVKIMGRIGGEEALGLLWNKIEYPDQRILNQILLSFRYCDYQAKENQITQLTILLENEIGKSIWNLAALTELPDIERFSFLRAALKEEVATNTDNIFILLSIIYDPQSVQLVRENIESGSADGTAFAIELLDLFIAPDLKPLLFPLLDDMSVNEKVKLLQIHFPRDRYNEIQVLNYLLNRNYNKTNRWTKACTLHALAFMPEFKVSNGLAAQLFNNDYLIQEAAAWVIYHKDRNGFEKISKRLDTSVRLKLEDSISKNQLIDGLNDGFLLNVEIVMFLRTVPLFESIKGLMLCELANRIDTVILQEEATLKIKQLKNDEHLYIVADGEISVKNEEQEELSCLKVTEVLGSITGQTSDKAYIQARKRSLLLIISISDFYDIMSDNHELARGIIENLTKLTERETIQ
ncbi:MAG: hypothetical protein AAFN93_03005 [Bacteroidota bacterium]